MQIVHLLIQFVFCLCCNRRGFHAIAYQLRAVKAAASYQSYRYGALRQVDSHFSRKIKLRLRPFTGTHGTL